MFSWTWKARISETASTAEQRKYARYATTRAIKLGLLKKSPCIVCGKRRVVAHHENYSKSLDVMWLCKGHHHMLHFSEYRDEQWGKWIVEFALMKECESLSEKNVSTIMEWYDNGATQSTLANYFKVSYTTIHRLVRV